MRYPQRQKPPLGSMINWAHPLSRGLVGLWLFNESSGLYVSDLSGNNNRGILTNGPLWVPGTNGPAIIFDGTDDYINCGDKDIYSFGNEAVDKPFSLVAIEFHSVNQGANSGGLINKYNNNSPMDGEYLLAVADTNVLFFQCNDASAIVRIKITGSQSTPVNKLNHVVATYDGKSVNTGLNLYVNGIKDTSPTRATDGTYVAMHNYASTLDIGFALRNSTSYKSPFNGRIELAMIYNRELSAAKVASLYYSPYAMFEQRPYWMDYVVAGIEGATCWGHVTGVLETNVRTFASNWTGTGAIENSGDAERLALNSAEYMEGEVVNTGTKTVQLLQSNYSAGDTVVLKYRHGATYEDCIVAGWNTYVSSFVSLGYVQVRVEATA